MARKSEIGIDYFPMNTDIINSPKIRLLVAEFGSKTTWTVLLPLYCKIYREKGYWIDWHDVDSKLLFAQDDCKIEVTAMNEFVNGCLRRSLFNKEVYDMFGVLTSDRIQNNYLEAKARNKEVLMIEEFAVKNEKGEYVYKSFHNVNIIDLNVNIIAKKVDISTQKKNENKKKITEGESAKAPTHTKDEFELFDKFNNWVDKHTPRVNKMKEPLTIIEYFKLKNKMNQDVLTNLLKAMQNRPDLFKKNLNTYLTLLNWSKREDSNQPMTNEQQQPTATISELLKSRKQETAD